MRVSRIARVRVIRVALAASVVAAGLLVTPSPASAEEEQQADFAFGWPRWSVAIRGVGLRARAEGDFYDYVQEHLFARQSPNDDPVNPAAGHLNFNAPGIAFHVGYAVTPRLDARIGVDYFQAFQPSEMRHFVGSDGLPIEQETTLAQAGLGGSITLALLPRGQAIGNYVWIPARVVPYVGVGAGMTRYKLTQVGEFVDFVDGALFTAQVLSTGWAGTTRLIAGADVRLSTSVATTIEISHIRGSGQLMEVFEGFDPIDLSGLRIGAGIRVAF
ncbi:MAG: hypothetical protein F4Z04_14385 [Acidobacteria bacterium]|nr:hypothetical protein [Acidobacteriota bacterium]